MAGFGDGAPRLKGGAPLNLLQRGGGDALRDPRRGKTPDERGFGRGLNGGKYARALRVRRFQASDAPPNVR